MKNRDKPFIRKDSIAVSNGGLAGTRTPDQCLKRALLYQLSYQPITFLANELRK